MRFRLLIGAFLFFFCAAAWQPVCAQPKKSSSAAKIKSSKQPGSTNPSSESAEVVNPGVFLLRDPLVQVELQLTAAQRVEAAALAAEFNESIWRFRDASIESDMARREARIVNALIDPRLDQLLNSRQCERLAGIILQIQGTSALSYSSTVQKLSLTSEQQNKLSQFSAGTKASLHKLKEQATGSKNVADLNRQAEKVQTALQRDLQAVLTKSQLDRWIELRGSPFDISKLQPHTAQAPELRGVNEWINSEPLSLKAQRGKVVVLHFWTFGCINCIHNYPWYKGWHEQFRKQDVTVIGVHTPESEGEKVVENIRKKARESGLKFPIAVDSDQKNWQAWSNTIWPAVYLVDKRGFVRYWWYGELNWKGTEGEAYLRDKIRELIAEK